MEPPTLAVEVKSPNPRINESTNLMTIAVHISDGKYDLVENFNFACFSALAISRPESHFIFIFDSAPSPEIYLEPNCTPVILPPVLKNTLLRHYWYNYKLPAVIKRYNADLFITDGPICSFRVTKPQCMVVRTADFRLAEKNAYLKRFLPAFIKKASHIFTSDHDAVDKLQNQYTSSLKTSLLHPGIKDELPPLTFEEREAIKEQFTGGNEYFLHITSRSDFENVKIVLKAFSILKKWQKSAMRMVLLAPPQFEPTLLKELGLYKHREDVLLVATKDSAQKLIGGAYAVLLGEPNQLKDAIRAMKSGVPVIASEKQSLGNTLPALLETGWNETAISEKMMKLYKDETFRSQIIDQGFENAAIYSWDSTVEKIWAVLDNLLQPQTA